MPVSESTASEFHAAATAYCTWCERDRSAAAVNQANESLNLLARLYVVALNLPPPPPCGDDIKVEEVSQEEWQAIYDSFGEMPFNYYGVVQEPHVDLPGEAVIGDVADDLADVYRDIKDGMNLWEAGHHVEAVWHWGHRFGLHWGRHTADALRALHTWLEQEVEP